MTLYMSARVGKVSHPINNQGTRMRKSQILYRAKATELRMRNGPLTKTIIYHFK